MQFLWMLLKRGTGRGSGEQGARNGERRTEVWERVVSGNLYNNPNWRCHSDMGIPIPISLAFWASPVGDAQNADRFDFA